MKRRNFVAGATAAMLGSCTRMDQRGARYDEKECPFCIPNPTVCHYCRGDGKCSFCKGTGKRTTVAPDIPADDIRHSSYEEDCPYCKATGKCRYCDGVGKCWACKGTARIESWDFFGQYQQEEKASDKDG
ncbi:MAG: hypothetical protein GF398_20170 [Chitinivibrionales bacterium]|nr:hypothetical protein [Chitinivibrionales bacterium]